MKKSLLALFIIVFAAEIALAQSTAMTYNLRFNNPNDGVNWWENRKEWVANLIRFYEPDVMGIQEGKHEQVMFLDSALTNYSYVGVGRDDGKTGGEYSAVFYRNDVYRVIDTETFWLSETPEEVSVGWDASMERISTWALMEELTSGNRVLVFNAHLDHIGPESRLNALKLVHQKAEEINTENYPLIVMGDFNATPESAPIQFMTSVLNDSKEISEYPPFGPEGTFNGFDTSHPLDNRIDYVFVNDAIHVEKYGVIADTRNERTPSDHLPVIIYYTLK